MVAGFFTRLTPERAFTLFLIHGFAGSAAIVLLWGDRFAPVLGSTSIVSLYGLLLIYSQNRAHVILNLSVKNSPYILGFLLTMVALVNIFARAPLTDVSDEQRNALTGQVGAAVFTTIFGLVFRQYLFATDPVERNVDDIYGALQRRMRKYLSEFERAQKGFVALIQEFVDRREELFSREETAFQNYVDRMEKAGAVLNRVEQEYPPRLQALLAQIQKSKQGLQDGLAGLEATVRQSKDNLQISTKQLAQSLTDGSKEVGLELDRFIREVGKSTDQLATHVVSASEKLASSVSSAADEVVEVSRAMATVEPRLASLNEGLSSAASSVSSLPREIEKCANSIHQATGRLSIELQGMVDSMSKDIRAMDLIVEEVSSLLKKRLQRLA